MRHAKGLMHSPASRILLKMTLRPRRAKIRLTKAGWLYAGTTLLLGLAAVNTADNLLYLVTSFLLAVMATSSFLSFLNLSDLEISMEAPRHTFREHPTPFRLEIQNNKRFPSFLLRFFSAFASHPLLVFHVTGRGTEERLWVFRFPTRGWHEVRHLEVRSGFPFGLAYRTEHRMLSSPARVLVYPRIRPVSPEELTRSLEGAQGEHPTEREGTGGDFGGLRPFQYGDSPRRIYWRSFWKTGAMETKRFLEEGAREVTLEVPHHASEETLDDLASLTVALLDHGVAVGLNVMDTGEHLPPRTGEAQKHLLLKALALYPEPLGWMDRSLTR